MFSYESFKGRHIDTNKKVMVYKNLHNGKFSIKQDGLVVAHVDSIVLSRAIFKVNESGRQRVIKEQKKNVHAFIVGYPEKCNTSQNDVDNLRRVTYNPYESGSFYFKENKKSVSPLGYDSVVCSTKNGIHVQ